METLKKLTYSMPRFALAIARDSVTEAVLPALTAFLFAVRADKLQAALGLGGSAPLLPMLALALTVGLWCFLPKGAALFAALGTLLGSTAAGLYAGSAAALMLIVAVLAFSRGRGIGVLYKCALLLGLLLSLLPLGLLLGFWRAPSAEGALGYIALCGLTLLLLAAMSQASSGLAAIKNRTALSDAMFVALAVLAGFISAAFGSIRILSVSPGAVFAAVFCLLAVHARGLAAVAFAAIVAVLRVFGAHLELTFIAVLCSCTLASSLMKPVGRVGETVSFALVALVLFLLMRGSGVINPLETVAASALFYLVPARLCDRLAASCTAIGTETENKNLLFLDYRLNALADVLGGVCDLMDCENASENCTRALLHGTAECLYGTAGMRRIARAQRLKLKFGGYCMPKAGNDEAGDSSEVKELDGGFIAAISDGMGSGRDARRESLQSVRLFTDLVASGFRLDTAAECVNALLLAREGGEMYATLDAVLFDTARGSLSILKQGAPPCFILRGEKVDTLYAEALPIGIVAEARPAVLRAKLKKGDAVIMMSDGVFDALGDRLELSLDAALREREPTLAAMRLTELACASGAGMDDMTVMIACCE